MLMLTSSAVCPYGCIHGFCSAYSTCTCDASYTGHLCEIRMRHCHSMREIIFAAVCRAGCSPVNGGCTLPNQCNCAAGWIGENCTTRRFKRSFIFHVTAICPRDCVTCSSPTVCSSCRAGFVGPTCQTCLNLFLMLGIHFFQLLCAFMTFLEDRGCLFVVPTAQRGIPRRLALLSNHSHHSNRDDLAGTSVYGSYGNESSQATFSIAFSALITPDTEVMLVTGTRSDYIVTRFADFATQGEYALNHSQTTGDQCL